MPNRLISETSPYLRQHAHNPVDWFPWGDDAFAAARAADRPILLSIGYSACHWCHVMERESFEDAQTARLMNERFVAVKVDREERPDVDAIYMQAVQAMTGSGGWPMTVFLTPDGEPFYGGTYFPPDDRHGMPSFRRVLASVADAWQTRRDAIDRTTASLRAMYAQAEGGLAAGAPAGALTRETLARAEASIAARHDRAYGGTRGAPKFPQAMACDFLLRRWARTGRDEPLAMATHTFRAMARGGMYDQVGGGFHRYAVDETWLVPHFEKMLYDNALLVRLAVHLWQATGDGEARRIAEETLGWLAREMTAPTGAFHATLDADSEGHEGRFYVWSDAELRDALDDADAARVAAYWNVTPAGNFEGANVLHVTLDAEPAAEEGTDARLADAVRRAKATLRAWREWRVRPARDDKIVAAWNGLMLRAVADAARAFDDAAWREMAVRNATFLRDTMVGDDGAVRRIHMDGVTRIDGMLEDHAAVALGFVAVHALTFDDAWLALAARIGEAMARRFWDEEAGAFFDTPAEAAEGPPLITRPRDPTDNATPSGTSLAIELSLVLAELTGDAAHRARADRALAPLAEPMARYATAFGHALGAADLAVEGAVELVIVGDPGSADHRALARAAAEVYAPSLVVTGGLPVGDDAGPLRAGRPLVDEKSAAYVCRFFACERPTGDGGTLRGLLQASGTTPRAPGT